MTEQSLANGSASVGHGVNPFNGPYTTTVAANTIPIAPPPVPYYGNPNARNLAATEFPSLTQMFQQEDEACRWMSRTPWLPWNNLKSLVGVVCDGLEYELEYVGVKLIILDIDLAGDCCTRTFNYPVTTQSSAFPNAMRPFVVECISSIRDSRSDIQHRVVMVDMTGETVVDLYTLDMLSGALSIDADALWYLYRQKNDLENNKAPNVSGDMQAPWADASMVTIGCIHAIYLEGDRSPLPGGLPVGAFGDRAPA